MEKPTVINSNVELYLGAVRDKQQVYINTDVETELAGLWNQKFLIAVADYDNSRCNSKNTLKWRNAYFGDFFELDKNGAETEKKMKAIHKVAYELIENKIIERIPGPKMSPRYHSDIGLVNATEALLNHEIDKMLSEEVHDESEHSCLIDGTTWLKVEWDPFDNTHERSGMPVVINCPLGTVFPQAGISDYRKLEYIFQVKKLTLFTIQELYGRHVLPVDNSELVEVVEVYYLNSDRLVGHFVYTKDTLTVLSNDVEWGMNKVRTCDQCGSIVPQSEECPICHSKHFSYKSMKEEYLKEDLHYVENKYRSGQSANVEDDQNVADNSKTIAAGTKVPFYLIRQLPFVPKRTTKVPHEIYGISEVQLAMEQQDATNKLLNKALIKSAQSKTYVTKLRDTQINDDDAEITILEIDNYTEGNAIKVHQVVADIQGEIALAGMLYDSAKSAVGVSDTDQGKEDPTAKSGDAKQLQLQASAKRQSPSKTQRNNAYAGVYELIFKYLLAYSNEERSFVALLPDGSFKEEVWSKYMFLAEDADKKLYYRDDFAWSVDSVAYITKDREAMWQLIDKDFVAGMTGSDIDPQRSLKLFWHMKDQYGYPTAKFVLNFLEEAQKHLPAQIEQALLSNPEAIQLALSYIEDLQAGRIEEKVAAANNEGGGAGGSRNNSGKINNGQSHAAQVDKTNAKNKTKKEITS